MLSIFVAGCGADDPSAADAPHGAATATAVQPNRSLRTASAGSAVDIVRAWIAARNDALTSGDTAAAAALAESCDTCADLLARVERVHNTGGFFRGGSWHVDRARVTEQSSDTVTVAADITVAPATTSASGESAPKTHPRDEISLRFVIDPSDRAPVRQMVFLLPRAGGAAGPVGGMIDAP